MDFISWSELRRIKHCLTMSIRFRDILGKSFVSHASRANLQTFLIIEIIQKGNLYMALLQFTTLFTGTKVQK